MKYTLILLFLNYAQPQNIYFIFILKLCQSFFFDFLLPSKDIHVETSSKMFSFAGSD